MEMNPELSIVIINWNSENVLYDCLKSIYGTIAIPFEVIVVDNASLDGSIAMIEHGFPDVILLKEKNNIGFSKGCNLGFRHAKGQYILFLNPDVIMTAGAIDKMVLSLRNRKDIGLLGPKILKKDGTISFTGKRRLPNILEEFLKIFLIRKIVDLIRVELGRLRIFKNWIWSYYEDSGECECLQGSCILTRSDFFKTLGGFDESVPMFLDDIDICYRSKQLGFRNFYLAEAEIIHIGQDSTKKAKNYKMYDVLSMQSHIVYYRKHFGLINVLLYKVVIVSSIPYLLALDLFSLPFFMLSGNWRERILVIIKHLSYLKLAIFNEVKCI